MSLSQPHAPNPYTSSAIQSQFNDANMVNNAVVNDVSQATPYGSLNYGYVPGPNGVPYITAMQTLNPQTQGLLNQYQGNQANFGAAAGPLAGSGVNLGNQAAGQAENFSNLGNLGGDLNSFAGNLATNDAGNLTQPPNLLAQSSPLVQQQMQAFQGYMQPFYNMQSSNLDSMLQHQGIGQGSQAWNNAQMGMNTSQDQAAQSALMNFEPQAFNQAVTNYALPIQTLGGLLGAGTGALEAGAGGLMGTSKGLMGEAGGLFSSSAPPGLTSSFYQPPASGNAQPGNYQGAAQNQYNAQQQQFQNTMSGLGTLGSGLLSGFGGLGGVGQGIAGLFGLGGIDRFPGGTFEGQIPRN